MKIEEVKRNLNKTVWFRNAEYVLSACTIRLGENGYFYQVLCLNKSAKEVNEAAELLGLKYAIMLDGGHLAAINGTEDFAKINSNCAQYYAVQGE